MKEMIYFICLLILLFLVPRELVLEIVLFSEELHLGLESIRDVHAALLAVQIRVVFLLSRRPDAFGARRNFAGTECAADVSSLLLELVQVSEALDVDGEEEVAELDGDLLAVLHAGDGAHEVRGGEARREDLDDGGKTVALVSGKLFARAADGEAAASAFDEAFERHGGIGDALAVDVEDPTGGERLAFAVVHLDLTALHGRGRTVERERERLVCREREDERIRAELRLDTVRRCDGRACVCAAHADETLLRSHCGVETGDAKVRGVARDDHAEAVLLCLVNGHLHAALGNHVAHSVVSIDNSCGFGFTDNLKVGLGVQLTITDTVDVDQFETLNAMSVETTLIGSWKNIVKE